MTLLLRWIIHENESTLCRSLGDFISAMLTVVIYLMQICSSNAIILRRYLQWDFVNSFLCCSLFLCHNAFDFSTLHKNAKHTKTHTHISACTTCGRAHLAKMTFDCVRSICLPFKCSSDFVFVLMHARIRFTSNNAGSLLLFIQHWHVCVHVYVCVSNHVLYTHFVYPRLSTMVPELLYVFFDKGSKKANTKILQKEIHSRICRSLPFST